MQKRLNPFDFAEGDDINEYDVGQRIVWFMLNNKSVVVENQKELSKAVNGLEGLEQHNRTVTQGTISKNLKKLLDRRFSSNGTMFMITKDEQGYIMLFDKDIKSKNLMDMVDKKCFKKRYVFHENILRPRLFVFWISPEEVLSKKEVKSIEKDVSTEDKQAQEEINKRKRKQGGIKMIKAFKDYIGEGCYEDIFIFQDKLVVMLNDWPTDFVAISNNLKEFFEIHKHMR